MHQLSDLPHRGTTLWLTDKRRKLLGNTFIAGYIKATGGLNNFEGGVPWLHQNKPRSSSNDTSNMSLLTTSPGMQLANIISRPVTSAMLSCEVI